MKKLIIKAVDKLGEKAISQHIQDTKKLSVKDRLVLKTAGYKHIVISDREIHLELHSHRANNPMYLELVKAEILKALQDNGANKESFTIEVKNE